MNYKLLNHTTHIAADPQHHLDTLLCKNCAVCVNNKPNSFEHRP